MIKVFIFFLSIIIGGNVGLADQKSVNSVVKETVGDQTPRESKTKSSED
jgi:hypothetical protein